MYFTQENNLWHDSFQVFPTPDKVGLDGTLPHSLSLVVFCPLHYLTVHEHIIGLIEVEVRKDEIHVIYHTSPSRLEMNLSVSELTELISAISALIASICLFFSTTLAAISSSNALASSSAFWNTDLVALSLSANDFFLILSLFNLLSFF